jgi:hypothetical protein
MTPFSFEFHASTSLPSPPRFPLHTPTRQPPLACICVAAHGQSIIIFTIDTSRPLLQSPTASPTSNVNLHRSSSLSSRKFTRCQSWTPPDARCDSLGSPTRRRHCLRRSERGLVGAYILGFVAIGTPGGPSIVTVSSRARVRWMALSTCAEMSLSNAAASEGI